jgi:hypothetical protein
MHDRTWMTGTWTRMRRLLAASVLTVICLLATGCTSATATTQATPPGTDVVTAKLADATWKGTFQVDGQLTNAPAHVGSAGCTAIGLMALDLHRGAIGTRGSVSGRLRVWAVTMSGTTGTSHSTRLQAGRFRLLGVPYGWLATTITNFPVGPTMQTQQMQGQFGAGRNHHRSLRGTFTLTRAVATADIRGGGFASSNQPPHLPPTEP